MVTIALYKVEAQDSDYIDTAISWYTRSKYTHVEIILEDGYMYSSSPRDGGVRRKLHNRDNSSWDYIELDIDDTNIYEFYKMTKDKKYDYVGIFGFVIPFKDKTDAWFCSEWCVRALQISNVKSTWLVNPGKIAPSDIPKLIQ